MVTEMGYYQEEPSIQSGVRLDDSESPSLYLYNYKNNT